MAEPPLNPARHSHLLCALAEEARAHPLARKLLVCRRHGEGLELLRALAAAGVPWIGFEATTPKRLALELLDADASAEAALLDEFDEQALIDEAIDDVLQEARSASRYAALAEGVGLRRALAHAVQALRLGGFDATAVRRRIDDPLKRDVLASILEHFDALRHQRSRIDAAELFARARAALSRTDALSGTRILILPGHNLRGASGAVLRRLIEQAAVVLPEDDVVGLDAPSVRLRGESAAVPATGLAWLHAVERAAGPAQDLALFAATSIQAELREVLRRIVAAGARWDEAEIVATDPAAYAVALDGVARRLHVPVGYATGLPVSRTRPGRVVAAYLRWLEEDFREDVIRGLIERSEIVPRGNAVPAGPTLARRLRRLRIGRGRARYLAAIGAALRALEHVADADDEPSPQEREQQRAREASQLRALESILQPILHATPELGDAGLPAHRRTSPAALARGVRATLELAHAETEVDRTAKDRLLERLARIETTLTRETTLRGALAILLEKLDERVPAPEAGGKAPWLSSGGRLHFTDLDGAGQKGRRLTFIVGVDAGRLPDATSTDAMLSDGDRRRLGAGHDIPPLPTSAERIEERRYAFAAALARLRGSVTLSYAAWSAAEGRTVAPSAELLQAYRLHTGDAYATYEQMHRALAPHTSAVPDGVQLDAADVWLAALDDEGLLRRGDAVVAAAFPGLGRGLAAAAARASDVPGPHHGILQPRASFELRDRATPQSASRLQVLGACPHRYLMQYVLGVRLPRDPEADPGSWLNALERGSALHEVFEHALRAARQRGIDATLAAKDDAVAALHEIAASALENVLARLVAEQPPPGQAVYEAERRALHADVRAFVHMLRATPRAWIGLEQAFGEGDTPVLLRLPGGMLRIRGKIDRIDRAADGALVVVDYKTGSTRPFRRETGVYAGGRRLQHAFYATGAEALHEGAVRAIEYHFPGERGRNEVVRYERAEIVDAVQLIDRLLDLAAGGRFVPTNEPKEDCRFCDMRAVCRVQVGTGDRLESPPGEWTARLWDTDLEALRAFRMVREGNG